LKKIHNKLKKIGTSLKEGIEKICFALDFSYFVGS